MYVCQFPHHPIFNNICENRGGRPGRSLQKNDVNVYFGGQKKGGPLTNCIPQHVFCPEQWTVSVRKQRGKAWSFRLLPFSVYLGEHWLNLFMQQDLTYLPSPLLHTASNQKLEPGELRLRQRGYLVPRTLIPVSVACHGSKSTDSKCTDITMI